MARGKKLLVYFSVFTLFAFGGSVAYCYTAIVTVKHYVQGRQLAWKERLEWDHMYAAYAEAAWVQDKKDKHNQKFLDGMGETPSPVFKVRIRRPKNWDNQGE